MFKNIFAVVLGYLTTIVVVFVGLTIAYTIFGADGAFEVGTYDVTMPWIITMFVVNIAAAVLGGIVCAKKSEHSKNAVLSFMLLIFILGMFLAFSVMNAPADATLAVREPDIKMGDAMMNAQKPTWVLFADPFVGVLGIMLGAMLVCPCRKNKCKTAEQAVE